MGTGTIYYAQTSLARPTVVHPRLPSRAITFSFRPKKAPLAIGPIVLQSLFRLIAARGLRSRCRVYRISSHPTENREQSVLFHIYCVVHT
jgi:hypothetical protein